METAREKISYILGRQVGTDLSSQNIDIDVKIFTDSLTAMMDGQESKLSEAESAEIMNAFQAEMQAKAMEQMGEIGEVNLQAGITYLEENKTQDGVTVTESGLQYKVITAGEGKTPTASCEVETHYEGKLIDGTIFDSSYQRGTPTSFPVNRVIAGWTEALQLMKEGDVWELSIPSALAYGAQGAGGVIGPNAALIFKIELIKVL